MPLLMSRVDEGGVRRLQWTFDALMQALEQGDLDPERRYEVLNGDLYEKVGQNWPHTFAVSALIEIFQGLPRDEYSVFCQATHRVLDQAPEPDIAVARGSLRSRTSLPTGREALLFVEVADSSILQDRNDKASIYAAGGVPVYWIVDLNRLRVEVYTKPEGHRYAEVRIFEMGERVQSPFEDAPEVAVADLIAPEAPSD